MSKYAKTGTVARKAVFSTVAQTCTYEGGAGHVRDPKSQLFILGASLMVKEGSFYESGDSRVSSFVDLIHQVTDEDPAWVSSFIAWLRSEGRVRTASIAAAAEYAFARGPGAAAVIDSACQRPDEPAEFLAYWHSTHGRSLPAAVRRGLKKASQRMYNDGAAMKYDPQGSAVRPADIIALTHPKPKDDEQAAVFKYLLDKRHNREELQLPSRIAEVDAWVKNGAPLAELPRLVTWERLSTYRKMDKAAWEAVLPQMGLMALTRNLRNFDQAGISDESVAFVCAKLADADEVAKSRQFPLRFYTAYRELQSLRYGGALETAMNHALRNVPVLQGKTLILVDMSGSMDDTISDRSTVKRWEAAGVFGAALALRQEGRATLVGYHGLGTSQPVDVYNGGAILRVIPELDKMGRGGTYTWDAFRRWSPGHNRTVIITDGQAHDSAPSDPGMPVFVFDIAGYNRAGSQETGQYITIGGGLSDACFSALSALDAARTGHWPWESK